MFFVCSKSAGMTTGIQLCFQFSKGSVSFDAWCVKYGKRGHRQYKSPMNLCLCVFHRARTFTSLWLPSVLPLTAMRLQPMTESPRLRH
jgi:hypothetical protein